MVAFSCRKSKVFTAPLYTFFSVVSSTEAGAVVPTVNLIAQRDHLIAQRDHLIAQRDHLIAQRDHLIAQRDHLIAQRNYLSTGRTYLVRGLEKAVLSTKQHKKRPPCNRRAFFL